MKRDKRVKKILTATHQLIQANSVNWDYQSLRGVLCIQNPVQNTPKTVPSTGQPHMQSELLLGKTATEFGPTEALHHVFYLMEMTKALGQISKTILRKRLFWAL